jgi:hypothetical protein
LVSGWTDKQYERDMQSIGWTKGDEWCVAAAILSWKKGYSGNPDLWQRASILVSISFYPAIIQVIFWCCGCSMSSARANCLKYCKNVIKKFEIVTFLLYF